MLKFEGFTTGQKIRAFDFEPMEGRRDRYVEGEIIEVVYGDFYAYRVQVEVDTMAPAGARTEVLVPFETTFDFDGRVVLLEDGEPDPDGDDDQDDDDAAAPGCVCI